MIRLFLLFLNIFCIQSFNFAPKTSLVYYGPSELGDNSYFGYSVGMLPGNARYD